MKRKPLSVVRYPLSVADGSLSVVGKERKSADRQQEAGRKWQCVSVPLRLCAVAFFIVVHLSAVDVAAQQSGLPQGSPMQSASKSDGTPKILRDIGIEQRLNAQAPLDIEFKDETGKTVQLAQYFTNKPVVLALVYYQCPMLCHQVLGGLESSAKAIPSLSVGKDFEVVAVSFDARETPEQAMQQKEKYLAMYERPHTHAGWHFLTGEQTAIDRLTEAVGFKYEFDRETNQFAHAGGIMVLTPEGKLSRYFYGIEYSPKDLRFGLIEASQNRIGSVVDQVLLYCYHYDPMTGKYGVVVLNVMRLAGAVTVVLIVILLVILRRREHRRGRLNMEGAA